MLFSENRNNGNLTRTTGNFLIFKYLEKWDQDCLAHKRLCF
jgi:hypothetical protein